MRAFFLPGFPGMRGVSVIESLAMSWGCSGK